MSVIFFIYALVDPKDGMVRYVGKTSATLQSRLRGHITRALRRPRGAKCAWIKELDAQGLSPTVKLLEACSEDQSGERERFWVKNFACLFNIAPAGAGGLSRKGWTEDEDAMLGWIQDKEVARILGCKVGNVRSRRRILKIKAMWETPLPPKMGGHNRLTLPDHIMNRLGTQSDKSLAKEIGVDKAVIAHRRRERWIPAYA